jgi:hypothetical protein
VNLVTNQTFELNFQAAVVFGDKRWTLGKCGKKG